MSKLESYEAEHNPHEAQTCGDVKSGFASPVTDAPHERLDLLQLIIRHPASTFYFRVNGIGMTDDDFNEGDIIVVDRSLEAADGNMAVCFIDGEFTVKRIRRDKDGISLISADKKYRPIRITPENELSIWGVVTYIIKKV